MSWPNDSSHSTPYLGTDGRVRLYLRENAEVFGLAKRLQRQAQALKLALNSRIVLALLGCYPRSYIRKIANLSQKPHISEAISTAVALQYRTELCLFAVSQFFVVQ